MPMDKRGNPHGPQFFLTYKVNSILGCCGRVFEKIRANEFVTSRRDKKGWYWDKRIEERDRKDQKGHACHGTRATYHKGGQRPDKDKS